MREEETFIAVTSIGNEGGGAVDIHVLVSSQTFTTQSILFQNQLIGQNKNIHPADNHRPIVTPLKTLADETEH